MCHHNEPEPVELDRLHQRQRGKFSLLKSSAGRLDRTRHVRPEPLVAASIGLGHNDGAIPYLERAWSERSSSLTGLQVDQLYDPLRSDPRFQDLLRRIGFAE